jgi:WD40 repeat protein
MRETGSIMSATLDHAGRALLLSIAGENAEIRAWDLDARRVVRRYRGVRQTRYVVRAAVGGRSGGAPPGAAGKDGAASAPFLPPRGNAPPALVASGSEDSQVYVWHRASGRLLTVLPGHSGCVSCVAWGKCPDADDAPAVLASGSDDHTVRLWG